MTDINITAVLQGRKNQRQQKMARFAKQATPARVRVIPRSDSLRRVLVHPNGTKFRETGSREWPLDQFTRRRLREGAITIEGQESGQQSQPAQQNQAPQQNHRAQQNHTQAPAPVEPKQSE